MAAQLALVVQVVAPVDQPVVLVVAPVNNVVVRLGALEVHVPGVLVDLVVPVGLAVVAGPAVVLQLILVNVKAAAQSLQRKMVLFVREEKCVIRI